MSQFVWMIHCTNTFYSCCFRFFLFFVCCLFVCLFIFIHARVRVLAWYFFFYFTLFCTYIYCMWRKGSFKQCRIIQLLPAEYTKAEAAAFSGKRNMCVILYSYTLDNSTCPPPPPKNMCVCVLFLFLSFFFWVRRAQSEVIIWCVGCSYLCQAKSISLLGT